MSNQFPSRRPVVMGFGGAVATSQPLAAQAGLRILMEGGNAADAAVATAAVLNVVEPMSTGMGGDAFALIYWAKDRRVYALNASGRAPYAATLEEMQRRGLSEMPLRGILPVTVPGAAAGWADTVARFGRLGLDRVLQPAIDYAEGGFPVSAGIARSWQASEALLREDSAAAATYLPNGRAPRAGERRCSPDLARSLRLLAEGGADAFYHGPIARAIVATSERYDGLLTLQDLADHTSTWVEPIHTDYRGYRVCNARPTDRIRTHRLNILEVRPRAGLPGGRRHAPQMEAVKLGMTAADQFVADPEQAAVPWREISRAPTPTSGAAITLERAISTPTAACRPPPRCGLPHGGRWEERRLIHQQSLHGFWLGHRGRGHGHRPAEPWQPVRAPFRPPNCIARTSGPTTILHGNRRRWPSATA